jgi:D-alanyl-lipoteichoic acid acyltransferase DltB (MBOAT superfamily)
MLFPTLEYAVFFLVALAMAWSLNGFLKAHLIWLLLSSYFFYAYWEPDDLKILVSVSLLAWFFGHRIYVSTGPSVKLAYLWAGSLSFLIILVYFKYTGFLMTLLPPQWLGASNAQALAYINPSLPLGISFIVFHAISLLFDAYRGKLSKAPGVVQVLVYISFFPQLIAGPILRAAQFLPQLDIRRSLQHIKITRGLILISIGLVQKVIIANYLGTSLVDPVFSSSGSEGRALLAVYGYAIQIFCDFCGYTNIAIGCALLLGYRFPLNFRNPYCAVNIQDFWRRWHITLSTWLRDYLYITMGGSRKGFALTLVFLFITMLLGGLWHGAGWQFVFWGAFHGLLLVAHRIWMLFTGDSFERVRRSRLWRCISVIITFHCVCVGWIWFRAADFSQGLALLGNIIHEVSSLSAFDGAEFLAVSAILTGLAMQMQSLASRARIERWIGRRSWIIQGLLFGGVMALIESFAPIGVVPFIYFQF